MANDYFTETGAPAQQSSGDSSVMRSEFTVIGNGFDKLPGLTGNGDKTVVINAGGTAQTVKTAAEMRTLLGLVIGTDVQAQNATLQTLTSATAAGLALMDDANAAAQLVTLGLTATAAEINVLDGIAGIKDSADWETGSWTSGTISATSEVNSGDIAHSLGTDDIDIAFTVIGNDASVGNYAAATAIIIGGDKRMTASNGYSNTAVVTAKASTGNILIYARNNSGVSQTITVKYTLRKR